MKFPKGTRTQKNKIFMKFFTLHKSMMYRCYNPKNPSYKNYGAKNVKVDKFWHSLDNFLETIDKVEGFDLEKIISGELELDKDIKFSNNKIYSVKNCKFVSKKENCGNRNNNKEFVAISPNYEIFFYKNREEFCRKYKMNTWTIFNILNAKKGTYRGWQFFYKEDFKKNKIKKRQTYIVVHPNGMIEEFDYKISEFAKKYNLCTANISMVISGKNKHHKKFQFWKKEEFSTEKILNLKK